MAWKYFSLKGDPMLACPCCDRMGMHPEFMKLLDEIRYQSGFPFHVNSGYRCGRYNNQMAKSGLFGPHTTGRAVDIRAETAGKRYIIMEAAQEQGFKRFGIGASFIHIDNLQGVGSFSAGIWHYP